MTRDRERGSVAVEVAILTPALLLLAVIAVVAGRTSMAASIVADAANDAARSASLTRTASNARAAATASANTTLSGHDYACIRKTITTDTSGFNTPVGQPATVTVTISCQVSYADLVKLPIVPGAKTITDSFTSPLDQYRGRK